MAGFLTTVLTTITSQNTVKNELLGELFKKEKPLQTVDLQGFSLVEVTGFEPATFWSRTILSK